MESVLEEEDHLTVTESDEDDAQSSQTANTPSPQLQSSSSTYDNNISPNVLSSITQDGKLERTISTAAWVGNLIDKNSSDRVKFQPLQTTVTYDGENITPDEAVVYIKNRVGKSKKICITNAETIAVTSVRAAAEIINSIVTTNFQHYNAYSSKNLIPLFMAGNKHNEFGAKVIRQSNLRSCFLRQNAVESLLKDFQRMKTNAAKAFIDAVKEKSVVNAALAAWNAGTAANVEKMIEFCYIKYSQGRKYTEAGVYKAAMAQSSSSSPNPPHTNTSQFLADIEKRHKGNLNFDSASYVFNTALSRVFLEYKNAIDSQTLKTDPAFTAIRQNSRRCRMEDDVPGLGMLAPRTKYSVVDYMIADRDKTRTTEEKIASKIATDFERVRGGKKRRVDTSAEDLKQSLASSVSTVAIDAQNVTTAADLFSFDGEENYEYSIHITQLFAQAFLESIATLLSCVFDVRYPFTDEGFNAIEMIISRRDNKSGKVSDMDPGILVNRYLLLAGNFKISPFHPSDPKDIIGGRQVTPHTPILSIITKHEKANKGTVTDIYFRDRLLLNDTKLNEAIMNVTNTPMANRNVPTAEGEDKKPMLSGCLPIIRGPLSFSRNSPYDVINSMANDWYIIIGVDYAMGKSIAAIAAGHQRALASAASLSNKSSSTDKKKQSPEDKKIKFSLRENADRSARLLALLGQTVSNWGYNEHNSTLDTFWSSNAAIRTKAKEDAYSRSHVIATRRQLDGKCSTNNLDNFSVAEQYLRDLFFQSVSGGGESTMLQDNNNMFGGCGNFLHQTNDNNDATSVKQLWTNYIQALNQLDPVVRQLFDIKGLFSAINAFKFPVVSLDKTNNQRTKRRKRENLRGANQIINGLTEMTLQTAIDGTSINNMGIGIGSAADGWTHKNTIQPSRLRALKVMSSSFSRNKSGVVSIPVSRNFTAGSGVKCVDIPFVIVTHLVSDKKILDSLCRGSMNLSKEILKFIDVLSGNYRSKEVSSIFTNSKHTFIFLRYIWFNTAIISLTDANIKVPFEVFSRGTGDDLYRDYLAIRSLVNQYNGVLANFSIQSVSDHYNCKQSKNNQKNITIKTQERLLTVLQQTANTLTAFTDPTDLNLNKIISPVNRPDVVQDAFVSVGVGDEQTMKNISDTLDFLDNIKKMNENIEEYLKRYSLGEGLEKKEMDNFSYPNIGAIFKRQLGVSGAALTNALGEKKTIQINLNIETPLIIKASNGFASNRYATLNNIPQAHRTPEQDTELATMASQMALVTIPKLDNSLEVPAFMTAEAAINVVTSFTEQGRFSNANTHIGILSACIEKVSTILSAGYKNEKNNVNVQVKDVGTLVQNTLLICFILAHSKAATYLFKPTVQELSKLISDILAETSLVVSRLQNSFYPLPPAIFTLGGFFKMDKDTFDEISKNYVSEIVQRLGVTSNEISSICDDGTSSSNLYRAGKNFKDEQDKLMNNTGNTPPTSTFENNLENPAKVWSVCALPHFDVAIVPKLQSNISSDQLFRLSTYYHGIHKLALNADCKPQRWENTLAGNKAGNFFGLRLFSDNKRTFNLALDTVLASPAEVCDLISREVVRTSTDVIHNIGSLSNADKIQKLLDGGASAVKKYSPLYVSNQELIIQTTIASLAKLNAASTSEGRVTAREIIKTWNTPALLNYKHMTKLEHEVDVVNAPLVAVPAFRQNVVEATRCLYELAAVCSIMSTDKTIRNYSRKIMGTVEETSPVMQDIGIDRVAGLVSTVATNKQYKKFLQTILDHRNTMVRNVNINNPTVSSCSTPSGYAMRAVYDGIMSASYPSNTSCSSTPYSSSLSDRFWMGVFSECLETDLFSDRRTHGHFYGSDNLYGNPSLKKVYGSRVNTYAALSSNVDRLKTSISSMDKDRREKIEKSIKKTESYVKEVIEKDTMTKLVDAQKMYNKLSDITANSVYSDFRNISCLNIMTSARKKKTARQQSDDILSALLHELSSMIYVDQPDLAAQLALAGHIITAKGVSNKLNNVKHQQTFDILLSVAGVCDYAHIYADAVCQRLSSSDIKLFLGGTMLQRGLFVTFLLNNILFSQISDTLRMDDLSDEAKSLLTKLIGFCGTVSDAFSSRRFSGRIRGGVPFKDLSEKEKLDKCYVGAMYTAYRDLRRKTQSYRENETMMKIFGSMQDPASINARNKLLAHQALRGPRPKTRSALTDVLEAPSTISKTFLVSYSEKAAATRQVRKAGIATLANNNMEVVYGADVVSDMKTIAISSDALMDICNDDDMDEDMMSLSDLEENDIDLFGSLSSGYSSTSSSSEYTDSDDTDDSDDNYYYSTTSGTIVKKNKKYSYDALDCLNAAAKPLSAIYACADDQGDDDMDDGNNNSELSSILRNIGNSDNDDDEDDDDREYGDDEYNAKAALRRSERIQYGPVFVSHSNIFKYPMKAKAFLTRGKKFKPTFSSMTIDDDDLGVIFSDEFSSSSSSSPESSSPYKRRSTTYKKRRYQDHCSFVHKAMRAFMPTKVSMINGRVNMIAPDANSDEVLGFFKNYQKANKKERDRLREKYNILAQPTSNYLPDEYLKGTSSKQQSPKDLRRSLIKASAYLSRTLDTNSETFFQALVKPTDTDRQPSDVIGQVLLFSEELKAIIDRRNELLKDLSDTSSTLFTSSVGGEMSKDEEVLENAQRIVSGGTCARKSGYLGVPLQNIVGCMNGVDTVDELLARTDKNHLEWLTLSAVSFARAFNVTTYHALDSTLKTTAALTDMYNAFKSLIETVDEERLKVKSTLLDSIFNTRMAHLEAVMGLVYPTAFINHELPKDPFQQRNFQSLALNILRGVNCNQLPRGDIGDTSGLLTFVTSPRFAGRGGEKGGLSLYRMSIVDTLSCKSPEKRLKGAVSLEVGKWKTIEDSVFSRRSKDLVDYCKRNNLCLENAVGPIARFVPDGSDMSAIGLSETLTRCVADDPTAIRLQGAEKDCGKFITASAMGNLFGAIDNIVLLTNKFTEALLLIKDSDKFIDTKDMVTEIIGRLRSRRNKCLKTPFGDTTISRQKNLPSSSEAIIFRAKEIRNSIATVVMDISKRQGINSFMSRSNSSPTKVSPSAFQRILETSAVLANTKTNLRGIENRLAAALSNLKQFKHISTEGLSESRAVVVTIGETLATMDLENGKRMEVSDLLRHNSLFMHIISVEHANIEEAKKQVTAAIEGASQLHAKMLSILVASSDINRIANRNTHECQILKRCDDNNLPFDSFTPMTNTQCGTIIKHKDTGVWLKTDQECNTKNFNDSDHKKVAKTIFSTVEKNRNEAIRSKLQTLCFGKYAMNDIFVLDNADVNSVDKLVEKLAEALAEKVTGDNKDNLENNNCCSSSSSAITDSTSSSNTSVKTIPYIPIIFQNKQQEVTPSSKNKSSEKNKFGEMTQEEQMAAALHQLEIQESGDLSNVLSVATKHKFATHNQAATVAIFNGSQRAESVIPKRSSKTVNDSIFAKLPEHNRIENATATSMQLPPDAFAASNNNSGSKARDGMLPINIKLRNHAMTLALDGENCREYKELMEVQKKLATANKNVASVEYGKFIITRGIRPEIKQETMATLSQAQSSKDGALEILEKLIKTLESYTSDSSMAPIALPVNTSNNLLISCFEKSTTSEDNDNNKDFFHYAYQKLNNINNGEDQVGKATLMKNAVELDTAIRIPLLLSSPSFAKTIRDVLQDLEEYFKTIEKIKAKISVDAKDAVSVSIQETNKEIETDKNHLMPVINTLKEMYSSETDNIKTAIRVLENKKKELELQNNNTLEIIEKMLSRIEAGDSSANVNDMLDYGNKADSDQLFLANLKSFANNNSGRVFTPPASLIVNSEIGKGAKLNDCYKNLMRDATDSINNGQNGVVVNFESAINAFPTPSTEYGCLTLQTAESKQRGRVSAVRSYIEIILQKIQKLHKRLEQSATEATEVSNKEEQINNVFNRQIQDRYTDVKNLGKIAEATALGALSKDIIQSSLTIALGGKVDKLLIRLERVDGRDDKDKLGLLPTSLKSTSKRELAEDSVEKTNISDPSYACLLQPLHVSIKRMITMYNLERKGPLSNSRGINVSEADLQLLTIFDFSKSVLESSSPSGTSSLSDLIPSAIVPGLCQQCAMMLTNMHEATHESSHKFNFENKRSLKNLTEMLNAATASSDNQSVRQDVLTMLDSNNGYIKEFSFTKKQKVICLTPVNTLLGETFNGNVAPNTVILPTSELFSCPGVEHDKFRSMVHRKVDKAIADAPKTAASIVETLARTSPSAEHLYFPFKDQRRHFNSITDAIVDGMGSEAASQLNTTCDQNLVAVDNSTGFPVFVGRKPGKTRVIETTKTNHNVSNSGGIPVFTPGRQNYVNMGVKYMVAPGSLLNANKEETLRLNRLSDINNVRHYNTDIHVAGANSAWRIGEVMKAASTCTDKELDYKKMLLFGSVSAISAQKSASYINDPTAMLNTSVAVQNLVNQAFPKPGCMTNYLGAAESAFSTQLAYKQRLFPQKLSCSPLQGDGLVNTNISSYCPMDIVGTIRTYNDAYKNFYGKESKGNGICENVLKRSIANVPLTATPYGAFEEVSSAIENRISPLTIGNNDNTEDEKTNYMAVKAMTDTVVDTLTAFSTMVGGQGTSNITSHPLISSLATSGRPPSAGIGDGHSTQNNLLQTISNITRDANLLAKNDGLAGPSFFNAFSRASSSSPDFTHSKQLQTASSTSADSKEATVEIILGTILNNTTETHNRLANLGAKAGVPENAKLHRNVLTSILQMNEDEITRDINDIESKLETRQLRNAFQDLKRSMLISSSSPSSVNAPLSVLMSRTDAANGLLSTNNDNNIIKSVDEFNTTPLLVRHILLDTGKTPVPMAKEIRSILTQPKALTAKALLSEQSPLLTELCLYNTRDTHPERAIDRLVTTAYLVKQAKRFDAVDPIFPAAITCASHLMLSSLDSKCSSSSFLNNIKLHMNDTTCLLKNIQRYEKLLGRYGDAYAMSHRQNCNCPFALHHTFTPSEDEHLVSSFAFARPEVTPEEIAATPYQANKFLNDKHYVMNLSKIDTRVSGSALLRKISEWAEMRMNANFNGVFEPSRLALSNSGMTTAGVNLDVIVKPNNAKNVLGILECHRQHVCSVDAKSTIASAMPSIFQSTQETGNTSELVQNALPRNRYIQKSTMNAQTLIFANVLEQLIGDLGRVIVNELAGVVAKSVPKTVYENTKDMINQLGVDALFFKKKLANESNNHEEKVDTDNHFENNTYLVSDAMKNAIYHTLISGKGSSPENVPFASSASGPLAYDFLLSKGDTLEEMNVEHGAASAVSSMPANSALRRHLASLFEAISKQVSDSEFKNILDEIEAKVIDDSSSSSSSSHSSQQFTYAIRHEFKKIISFIQILRNNIKPALLDPKSLLSEKMGIYLSLLSAKSKFENFMQYGLSNSSSVDLSHLKPINCNNTTKNIEDTFMYRNVHPILIMALPENFTALLQQEQSDPEAAIESRRALTTFLNHPNTSSMATGARAAIGAGGGNAVGMYLSSHILHESTVTTSNPVNDTTDNLKYHSSLTQDPVMVVNPFKNTANIIINRNNEILKNQCSYLQVSMPTESSGLVTNTGYIATTGSSSGKTDNFVYMRRDKTKVVLPRITPAVLCSDASSNLLDVFSRANVVLEDVDVRFGFMPEIILAVSKIKGISKEEAIKEMVMRSNQNGSKTKIDPKTGDVIVKGGVFPDTRTLYSQEQMSKLISKNYNWGEGSDTKMKARALPTFFLNNPIAAASVNGVPITLEGNALSEEKRRKALGFIPGNEKRTFGAGYIGTGALRAAANSRLVSDLEPIKKGWTEIISLQTIFSQAAVELSKILKPNENKNVPTDTQVMISKLYNNYKTLTECRDILQNQAALLVATSDLVTGGYGGDPSIAMVSPVRPESTGLIGAISSPIRGIGHLLKRNGVAAVTAAIRQKLNLPTSNGTTLPEHRMVHKSSQDLLLDVDCISNMYYNNNYDNIETQNNSESDLGKIMISLGLRKGQGTGDSMYAAKHLSNVLASPEYGNHRDYEKRQNIIQLLISNPILLKDVAQTMFMTSGKNAVVPLTAQETACAALGTSSSSLLASSLNKNDDVQSLNKLFSSKLV
uniref:Wsv360-like protein n=1 Tax=Pasiphaea japonica whispovirus TaxID=2984286 RepID=A0A9C7BJE7_9VIRU|nr:MAG: wsv360-like protein [Pasiphaea japonica whispovirus]